MINISETKILFIQRVLTSYRLELLKLLCRDFEEVGIITSKGDSEGTLKVAKFEQALSENNNLAIHQLSAIRIGYTGESRTTSFFLYPQAIKILKRYDVIVFEGTTNLINNIYLVPIARVLGKKTIWWDAGYSLPVRSFKRKAIDNFVKPFVKITHAQMAYSTLAKDYLTNYMGAKKAFLNLNTINTSYFDLISSEIEESINRYKFDPSNIKLLYVGVVEERKKVKDLIDIVDRLNLKNKKFTLTIIGGGNQLDELKAYTKHNKNIELPGPMYDKETLKSYYFNSDLFVLPGDGGLAILQSLLFGLPVLSILGADGTELDYINDKSFLAESLYKMENKLTTLLEINRKEIIRNLPKIKHQDWIKTLIVQTKKLQWD